MSAVPTTPSVSGSQTFPRSSCSCCLCVKMTPSLLALAGSVTAVCLVLVCRCSPYYHIPAGCGVLGSAFTLYATYKANPLATLRQSVVALQAVRQDLSREVTILQSTNTSLTTQVDRLENNVVPELQGLNVALQDTVARMQTERDHDRAEFKKQIIETQKSLAIQQALVTTSVETIQQGSVDLRNLVPSLKETITQLQSTTEIRKQRDAAYLQHIQTSIESLSSVIKTLSLTSLTSLQEEKRALQEERTLSAAVVAQNQATAHHLHDEVQRLEEQCGKFDRLLKSHQDKLKSLIAEITAMEQRKQGQAT